MDECTYNVRTEYWKTIISQCQQRSTDQSVKQDFDVEKIYQELQNGYAVTE